MHEARRDWQHSISAAPKERKTTYYYTQNYPAASKTRLIQASRVRIIWRGRARGCPAPYYVESVTSEKKRAEVKVKQVNSYGTGAHIVK